MKKGLCIIACCVAVLSLLLGTVGFSFSKAKENAESIADSSETILLDVTSISVFSQVAKDFFSGARDFQIRLTIDLPAGDVWGVDYSSWDKNGDMMTAYEFYPISKPLTWEEIQAGEGMTQEEATKLFNRITIPLEPFIAWHEVDYNGAFEEVVNALQFIAYVVGLVWGVISLITIVLVDTVATAWELIRIGLKMVGLA